MTSHDSEHDIERLIRAAGSRSAPDAERTARVRASVERVWRQEVSRRKHRRAWMGAAVLAAAAVILFAILRPAGQVEDTLVAPPASLAAVASANGRVLVNGALASSQPGGVLTAGSRLETGAGATASVRFTDRTELRVHEDTALRLDAAKTVVLERGTIYLDMSGDSAGGYNVRTAAGVIRDIGTRFEVRFHQGSLRVRVRDGAVLLERPAGVERTDAGGELLLDAGGRITHRAFQPFGTDWNWTTRAAPAFNVENATLESFLAWAAREGGWTLETPGGSFAESARATRLHGDITGLTPEEALEVILPTCELTAVFSGGRVIVRRSEGGIR
jgi:ferric-dicitrate binding protein FerR (iron transport regulator)